MCAEILPIPICLLWKNIASIILFNRFFVSTAQIASFEKSKRNCLLNLCSQEALMRLTLKERLAVSKDISDRYKKASKKEKSVILDGGCPEICVNDLG